jgi:multidrug resistance efflux pump
MSPGPERTVDAADREGPAAPADPTGRGESLRQALAAHCRRIGAAAGAILRVEADGRVEAVSTWPPIRPDEAAPAWLDVATDRAGRVAKTGALAVCPLHDDDTLYDQPARRRLVLAPVAEGSTGGVAAFVTDADGPSTPESVEQSALSVGAMELYALHLAAARRAGPAELTEAMAVLAAVNEHDRFAPASMAFCNELAARRRCDRVSVGFLAGGDVRPAAMSHTERFSRKSRAVQLVADAMNECLDQDVEITCPAGPEADFVNRCARELSARAGAAAVLGLPLRRGGLPIAAVTLERSADEPFTPAEAESLRLTCELCTPRLADLQRRDRWIGARAASSARRALAAVVGPRHTLAKLLIVLLAGAAIYAAAAEGQYEITAPFVLAATEVQVVPAPYDGEIDEALVRVGDEVAAGQVLARLRTLPLQRRLNAARADLFECRKQADAARADKKWAEAQIAAARLRKLTEQVRLLEERIEQAQLRARISGTVIRGDLKRLVGASVAKGDVLLEVAPLTSLRAELAVPDDQIGDLLTAMADGEAAGVLATASLPDRKIDFVVERVRPMSVEQTVTACAKLQRTHDWMRPGMSGVARVRLGPRGLAWIWSRRLVNWLRLRLWM